MATGDKIKLGGFKVNGVVQAPPTNPWKSDLLGGTGRNVAGNITKVDNLSSFEFTHTPTEEANQIQWVEVNYYNKKYLVCDRNLILTTYNNLSALGLIFGKEVVIDDGLYEVTILTGGTSLTKNTNSKGYNYYGTGNPTDNLWDICINNTTNITGLITPNDADKQVGARTGNTLTLTNSAHNTLWNWEGCPTICQEDVTIRENGTINLVNGKGLVSSRGDFSIEQSDALLENDYGGYRPVLEYIGPCRCNGKVKFGSLILSGYDESGRYVNNIMPLPTRPWNPTTTPLGCSGRGNIPLFNHNAPLNINISNTTENEANTLQWVEIEYGKRKLYIADRNLVAFGNTITSQNYQSFTEAVNGTIIPIDGKFYKFYFGVPSAFTRELDNTSVLPVENIWDMFIDNKLNLKNLPSGYNSKPVNDNTVLPADLTNENNTFWNWYTVKSVTTTGYLPVELSEINNDTSMGYLTTRGGISSNHIDFARIDSSYDSSLNNTLMLGYRPMLELVGEFSYVERVKMGCLKVDGVIQEGGTIDKVLDVNSVIEISDSSTADSNKIQWLKIDISGDTMYLCDTEIIKTVGSYDLLKNNGLHDGSKIFKINGEEYCLTLLRDNLIDCIFRFGIKNGVKWSFTQDGVSQEYKDFWKVDDQYTDGFFICSEDDRTGFPDSQYYDALNLLFYQIADEDLAIKKVGWRPVLMKVDRNYEYDYLTVRVGNLKVDGVLESPDYNDSFAVEADFYDRQVSYTPDKKIEIVDSTGNLSNRLKWVTFRDANRRYLIAGINFLFNITWDDLYKQNLVYGKKIRINNSIYRLQLMTGGGHYSIKGGNYGAKPMSNLWDKAISAINFPDALSGPLYKEFMYMGTDPITNPPFLNEDLVSYNYQGFNHQSSYSICKETYHNNYRDAILRGGTIPRTVGLTMNKIGSGVTDLSLYGWRPVLEFLGYSDESIIPTLRESAVTGGGTTEPDHPTPDDPVESPKETELVSVTNRENLGDVNSDDFEVIYSIINEKKEQLRVVEYLNNDVLRSFDISTSLLAKEIFIPTDKWDALAENSNNTISISVVDIKGNIKQKSWRFRKVISPMDYIRSSELVVIDSDITNLNNFDFVMNTAKETGGLMVYGSRLNYSFEIEDTGNAQTISSGTRLTINPLLKNTSPFHKYKETNSSFQFNTANKTALITTGDEIIEDLVIEPKMFPTGYPVIINGTGSNKQAITDLDASSLSFELDLFRYAATKKYAHREDLLNYFTVPSNYNYKRGDKLIIPYSQDTVTLNFSQHVNKIRIHLYGASGGAYKTSTVTGGAGGYVRADVPYVNGKTIFITCGAKGKDKFATGQDGNSAFVDGFNGGGIATKGNNAKGCSGGGMTTVALNTKDNIIMVAAGGGGNYDSIKGGYGGGVKGYASTQNEADVADLGGAGGMQNKAGQMDGSKFHGGCGVAGGGAGYYGGGGSIENQYLPDTHNAGGGGSSYASDEFTVNKFLCTDRMMPLVNAITGEKEIGWYGFGFAVIEFLETITPPSAPVLTQYPLSALNYRDPYIIKWNPVPIPEQESTIVLDVERIFYEVSYKVIGRGSTILVDELTKAEIQGYVRNGGNQGSIFQIRSYIKYNGTKIYSEYTETPVFTTPTPDLSNRPSIIQLNGIDEYLLIEGDPGFTDSNGGQATVDFKIKLTKKKDNQMVMYVRSLELDSSLTITVSNDTKEECTLTYMGVSTKMDHTFELEKWYHITLSWSTSSLMIQISTEEMQGLPFAALMKSQFSVWKMPHEARIQEILMGGDNKPNSTNTYMEGFISAPRVWDNANLSEVFNVATDASNPKLLNAVIYNYTSSGAEMLREPKVNVKLMNATRWVFENSFYNPDIKLPKPDDFQAVENIVYIREQINNIREVNGLLPINWVESEIRKDITTIKASHWNEIQRAIIDSYEHLSISLYSKRVENVLRETIRPHDFEKYPLKELKQRLLIIEDALRGQN